MYLDCRFQMGVPSTKTLEALIAIVDTVMGTDAEKKIRSDLLQRS